MSFNRTFMELKSRTSKTVWTIKLVLIVPLWNWNIDIDDVFSTSDSFNRTFMELKWKFAVMRS